MLTERSPDLRWAAAGQGSAAHVHAGAGSTNRTVDPDAVARRPGPAHTHAPQMKKTAKMAATPNINGDTRRPFPTRI